MSTSDSLLLVAASALAPLLFTFGCGGVAPDSETETETTVDPPRDTSGADVEAEAAVAQLAVEPQSEWEPLPAEATADDNLEYSFSELGSSPTGFVRSFVHPGRGLRVIRGFDDEDLPAGAELFCEGSDGGAIDEIASVMWSYSDDGRRVCPEGGCCTADRCCSVTALQLCVQWGWIDGALRARELSALPRDGTEAEMQQWAGWADEQRAVLLDRSCPTRVIESAR